VDQLEKRLVEPCQKNSIKTLLHDSKIGPALWSRNMGFWKARNGERLEIRTAREDPQVSNFNTDVSLNYVTFRMKIRLSSTNYSLYLMELYPLDRLFFLNFINRRIVEVVSWGRFSRKFDSGLRGYDTTFYPDNWSRTVLRNIDDDLPECTASLLVRQ
jgi:hypothetical protein